jgi:Domain of unknown function (DUF4116)
MSDSRPRLDKILNLHGKALSDVVGRREPNDLNDLSPSREEGTKCTTSKKVQSSPKDLVLRFAGADPTDGKTRTQWLIKTYIQDEKFKLEDLGRVDAALAAFERFKRKLPVEQREINHLKTLSSLEALVAPFTKAEERARLTRDLSSATGRERRRLEEMKARDESIIVQEGEGLPTIAVPMTEFASKWWGRGTKWCTASEKNNAFDDYHKDAPLVIMVCADGEKFQMHVMEPTTFHFMDNTDTDVSEQTIKERWNEFKSLFYWAIEQNGRVLKHIPGKYKTSKLCRLAVERNEEVLNCIPEKYRNHEFYCKSVQQNGDALPYVPEKFRNYEIYRLFVEQNGLTLYYVPENRRTPELCYLAIKQNGEALRDIPENKRTPELCRLAIERNGLALFHVPEDHKTLELCRIAIEQNGLALKYVPKDERTPELCRLAVEREGISLGNVPKKYRTPELCRIAIEQNGNALDYLPEDQRTSELCRIAIKQHGLILQYLSDHRRIPELCCLAVEQNGEALQFVPPEHKTPELCRLAVQQNWMALEYVPENERTLELCRIAIEQNGNALGCLPGYKRTLELCRMAVEQDGNTLEFVPEKYETPEFLASIPPSKQKWNLDILQGLGQQSKTSQEFIRLVSL